MNLYLSRAGGDDCTINKLLNIPELERYMEAMKDPHQINFKPSTRKEKMHRLKLAIKLAKRNMTNEQLYFKATRVIDTIDEWCKEMSKDINIQRREHGLVVREALPHSLSVMRIRPILIIFSTWLYNIYLYMYAS